MARHEPVGAAVKAPVNEDDAREISREEDEGQAMIVQHDARADQRIEQKARQAAEQAEL